MIWADGFPFELWLVVATRDGVVPGRQFVREIGLGLLG